MRRVQVRQLAGHSYRFLAKQPVLLENFLLLIRCLLSMGMLETTAVSEMGALGLKVCLVLPVLGLMASSASKDLWDLTEFLD